MPRHDYSALELERVRNSKIARRFVRHGMTILLLDNR